MVWAAGFSPSALGRQAGLEVTGSGQVAVDSALRSISHPFVFAAGDVAAVPRAASSYGAYAATATGATAGKNAALDLSGQAVTPLNMGYLLTGRPASWLKEAVEHYVTLAVRAERTVPGIYHWSPAPKR